MKRILIAVFFLVISAGVIAGQEDRPQPDRWRGLVLDQATPEDAIRVLGQPESDKPDRLFIEGIGRWFRPGLNKKALRKLRFKKPAGLDSADLYFEGGKLAVIQLDFEKEITPTALANSYGLEFRPIISGFQEAGSPAHYERHKGQVYPKRFPDHYVIVATVPASILAANVGNMGGALKAMIVTGADTAGGGFPGRVRSLQLISRRLENREGTDVLK